MFITARKFLTMSNALLHRVVTVSAISSRTTNDFSIALGQDAEITVRPTRKEHGPGIDCPCLNQRIFCLASINSVKSKDPRTQPDGVDVAEGIVRSTGSAFGNGVVFDRRMGTLRRNPP